VGIQKAIALFDKNMSRRPIVPLCRWLERCAFRSGPKAIEVLWLMCFSVDASKIKLGLDTSRMHKNDEPRCAPQGGVEGRGAGGRRGILKQPAREASRRTPEVLRRGSRKLAAQRVQLPKARSGEPGLDQRTLNLDPDRFEAYICLLG